ncbi:hypothetical protein P5V15_002376 [Pogonomyrmex californicus]
MRYSRYSAGPKQNILYTQLLVLISNTGLPTSLTSRLTLFLFFFFLNVRLSVCQLLAMEIRRRYVDVVGAIIPSARMFDKCVDKGIQKISRNNFVLCGTLQ